MPDFKQSDYLETVLRAANQGAQRAIEAHRRMGRSVVVWRDGKVVKLSPQEIPPRALPGDEE